MKIEEKWPEKVLELPIPKPQEPFPQEFIVWVESKLTTKKFPRRERREKRSEEN